MTLRPLTRRALAGVAALTLVLAACGGDSDDSDAADDTEATTETTATTTPILGGDGGSGTDDTEAATDTEAPDDGGSSPDETDAPAATEAPDGGDSGSGDDGDDSDDSDDTGNVGTGGNEDLQVGLVGFDSVGGLAQILLEQKGDGEATYVMELSDPSAATVDPEEVTLAPEGRQVVEIVYTADVTLDIIDEASGEIVESLDFRPA